jgi:hypothetical protein
MKYKYFLLARYRQVGIHAPIDREILFGSYDRSDVTAEEYDERANLDMHSWLRIETQLLSEPPCPSIYGHSFVPQTVREPRTRVDTKGASK